MSAPVLLVWCDNLMFVPRIASVAGGLGFRVEIVEREDDLAAGGRSAFMDRVTRLSPALVVIDLEAGGIPWEQWVLWLQVESATRRIPLLGFGSHKDVHLLTRARSAGLDAVLARSRFFADMPSVIRRYADLPDMATLARGCAAPLHPSAQEGIRQLNAGAFYAAHESLEVAWMAEDSPTRSLYRALLQTAVVGYQLERGNRAGALKVLLRMRRWLRDLPDVCRGVDVADLRRKMAALFEQINDCSPEEIATIPLHSLCSVRLAG